MHFVRIRSWPRAITLAAAFALLVQTSALASPPAAAAAPAEMVVFVGGLGSTPLSSAATFAPLSAALRPLGFSRIGVFSYGTDAAASCQPIEASTAALADYLRGLRDGGLASRVVLVGHSNGGVVALGLLDAAPDLAGLVERVVTVDSPLEGIKGADAFVFGARFGECPAADELYGRHATADWPAYTRQLATWERSLGVDVRIVANTADLAVSTLDQEIPNDVAYELEAADPADWTNHSALLHVPTSATQLAAIVTGA